MDESQRPAHDDAADMLANMADGIHDESDTEDESSEPDSPGQATAFHDDAPAMSAGPFEEDDSVATAPVPRRRGASGMRKPTQPTGFHFVSAQLCIAMGILLMVPVIWSILVLAGVMKGGTDTTKWLIMLILAAPLGGLLLFGGLWYNNHLKRFRQDSEEDEAEE